MKLQAIAIDEKFNKSDPIEALLRLMDTHAIGVVSHGCRPVRKDAFDTHLLS